MSDALAKGSPVSGSEYIRWAKSRERFRYNLGRSSIRPCPAELLAARPEDLVINGDSAYGWPPLLNALGTRYGVESQRVVLAIGTSLANHLVCAALLSPGDHVLVESPGYEPLLRLPPLFGASVGTFARLPESGWFLDAGMVESQLTPETRLIILSNLHNPTGNRLAPGTLEDLAELARARDLHVLVDEVYLEFERLPGDGFAAGVSERLVSTSSLTKAYGLDGLRAGWIVASDAIAERVRTINDLYGVIMPHPSERLALRALERIGNLRQGVSDLLAVNRPLVEQFIAGRPELDWTPPAAGPVGFVGFQRTPVSELVSLLESEYDATLPAGEFFGRPDYFRIAFGMVTPDLVEGLSRLGRALDRLAR